MVSQKRKAAELVLQSDVVGARLLEAIACWLMLSGYFNFVTRTVELEALCHWF
jgi:hypothetical protein